MGRDHAYLLKHSRVGTCCCCCRCCWITADSSILLITLQHLILRHPHGDRNDPQRGQQYISQLKLAGKPRACRSCAYRWFMQQLLPGTKIFEIGLNCRYVHDHTRVLVQGRHWRPLCSFKAVVRLDDQLLQLKLLLLPLWVNEGLKKGHHQQMVSAKVRPGVLSSVLCV